MVPEAMVGLGEFGVGRVVHEERVGRVEEGVGVSGRVVVAECEVKGREVVEMEVCGEIQR